MEDEIRDVSVELGAAVSRGDAAAAAALYEADDWLLASSAELIDGRNEIEAYWRAGLALGLAHVDLCLTDLQVADAIAIEIGRYALRLAGDAVDGGKYVVLHRRQTDGTWRRAVDVFNPDMKEER
jgi:ketosteroid isomerase-like protein